MDIGRILANLEKRVERAERSSRLSHASIENTALQVYDGAGSLRGILGQQVDGTTAVNVVNGAAPPQPSAPIVTSVLGGVTVSWDGLFAGGEVMPLDWSRVEVHASITPVYEPIPATLQGTIETAQGATVVVSCDTAVYVRLLARNTSGTASTASATVGPFGPVPVVADDIVDGIVTTAKIAAGAVTINSLTASLADTAAQRYVDAMADPGAWTVLTKAATATWTFLTGVTDAPTGATVAQAAGYAIVRSTTQIAYDPDVLYRISVRARTTSASTAGADTLYIGLLGVGADGVTLVSRFGANAFTNQHYVAAANASQPSASGWVTYTGYVKARAATGTGTAAPDPRTPGVVHNDVRFVSAILYLNFASGSSGGNSGSGIMQVDACTIEALKTGVVNGTNLVAGSVTTAALAADSVTATQISASAVTTAKLDAGAVTTGKLAAGAVTANEIAANAITTGKLAAGAVDATSLAADAITGKTITGGSITGSTITGGVLQTATSGQRITLNEAGANKVIVYNSSDTAIGELSSQGLLVKGSTGAVLWLNPSATYPQLLLYNAASTKKATVQVTEPTTGDANLESFSGTFSGNGYTDLVWRNYLARDAALIERRRSAVGSTTVIGGRLFLDPTFSNLAFKNTDDTTQDTGFTVEANLAHLDGGRLQVLPPASVNSALYVNAATGHTGNLLRLGLNSVDKFTVDKDGNATAVGNITSTPVITTSGLTAGSGFTINSGGFTGYKVGKVVAVDLHMHRSGTTITMSGGNIGDTVIATLPAGWRPTHTTINGAWDDATSSGSWVVGTDGVCTLRTSSGDIVGDATTAGQGRNLRLHLVFIQD